MPTGLFQEVLGVTHPDGRLIQSGFPPEFLHLFLKVRMRITCIDDSLRVHRADHTQIFFFQPRISLCVAGKNAIPLLIGNRFNSLKKQYIIRTGQRRTQYNDQFFFSCVAFVFAENELLFVILVLYLPLRY